MNGVINLWAIVQTALMKLAENVANFAPAILGAVVILVIGYLIAVGIAWLVRKLMARLGVDRALAGAGLSQSMEQANIRVAPSALLGKLAFWIVMLTFVLAAFDSVGITAVTAAFSQLVAYIPNIFIAVVILVMGLFLAQAARSAATVSLHRMAVEYSQQIASAVYYGIALIAVLVATKQLKVDISAFENIVYIVLGSGIFFAGVLFVWSARSAIENIIGGYYVRRLVTPGTQIALQDVQGEVEVVQLTHVIVKVRGGKSFVPNSVLLRQVSSVRTA